jgi:hypothetical protein
VSEIEAAPQPTREEYIADASLEARERALRNYVSANMYHNFVSGDVESVRQAAAWIITSGPQVRKANLDDPLFIEEKKFDYLERAKQDVAEAQRLEEWAGHIYDNHDSLAFKAVKNFGTFKSLVYKNDIESNPGEMLTFETNTAKLQAKLENLKAVRDDVAHKLDTLTDLDTVDVSRAVKQSKPQRGDTTTILDLVILQKDILDEDVLKEEESYQLRTDMIEAIRTGILSPALKKRILEESPDALRETTHWDGTPLAELDLGVRSYNVLSRGGIKTVGDLLNMTEADLDAFINLGQKSQDEIKQVLGHIGLSLRGPEED